MVRCLVKELGADVSQGDNEGMSPVFIAAQYGNVDVLRCLVKKLDADVNQATHDGRTPLGVASSMGKGGAVKWLLKNGADAQAATQGFGTAAEISEPLPSKHPTLKHGRTARTPDAKARDSRSAPAA